MLTTSYTQINLFQKCPFSWYVQYVKGIKPVKMSDAILLGSKVHEYLEHYYAGVRAGRSYPGEATLKFIQREGTNASNMQELELVSRSMKIMRRYVEDYAPKEDMGLEIVGVEKKGRARFITPTGKPWNLNFVVDLLFKNQKGVLITMDHKVTSRMWTPLELDADLQQPLYILGMNSAFGVQPTVIAVNQINSYDYKNPPDLEKMFRRDKTPKTMRQLATILEEVGHVVDEMIEVKDGRKKPRRSLSRNCKFCHVVEPCFNDLRGDDINAFAGEGFTAAKD